MGAGSLRWLVAAALALHGGVHALALAALLGQARGGRAVRTVRVRSWAFPTLGASAAGSLASVIWGLAALATLAAAGALLGLVGPATSWSRLAVMGALVSVLGIALFSRTWPGSSSIRGARRNAAMVLTMDGLVLVSQLWLRWPPSSLAFG